MGAEESKSHVNHNGDQQVKIINTQIEHSELLDDHKFILYMILVVVSINLILRLVTELNNYYNNKAMKKVKSFVTGNEV